MRDLSSAERRELLLIQTGKLKETLAAMSLIEAEEALEEGDFASAINSFNDAIKNFPENPFYYIKLSEVFMIEQKTPDAIKTLKSALTYCPTNPVIKAKIEELEKLEKENAKKSEKPEEKTLNVPSPSYPNSAKSKYAKLNLPGGIPAAPLTQVSKPSVNQKEKIVNLPVKTLTKAQIERRERKKELKSQTGRLKETLAEMSLIEYEERLESQDRLGAMTALKEAIRNYPENYIYYIKLADMHAQDSKVNEGIEILTKSLERVYQPAEIEKKIAELQELIKPKFEVTPPPPPKELNELSPELIAEIDAHAERGKVEEKKSSGNKFNINKLLCPKCNQINDISDSKCSRCNTPLTRFNKLKIKSQEVIVELSNRIKARDIVILVLIALVVIVSFPLARREQAIVVEPIQPTDQGVLNRAKAEFQWDAVTENVGFILTIEKDGKKVLERYTNNLVYTLTYEESEILETGSIYQWQAIPVSPKRIALNYRTKKFAFRIDASKPNQEDNQQTQPQNLSKPIIQNNQSQKPAFGKGLDQ